MKYKLFAAAVFLMATMLTACGDAEVNNSGKFEFSNGNIEELSGDVAQLEVFADVGSLIIKEGDKLSVSGKNLNPEWLNIKSGSKRFSLTYQPPSPEAVEGIDTINHVIVITVPEEHSFSQLTANVGTGILELSRTKAECVFLSQGTGAIEIKELRCKELSIEAGAGNIKGRGLVVDKAFDLSGGTGSAELEGNIKGRLTIEGGTGSVSLKLNGTRENYDISGESFVRQILVNGQPLNGGLDFWEQESREAEKTGKESGNRNSILIEGGTGSLAIDFNEE